MPAKSLFSILFLFLSWHYVQATYVKASEDHPWDVLIFTQQWPTTVCKDWMHSDPNHRCTMPVSRDSWTIHGIWPTKFGTMGPFFCNRTWHFDPEQIKPIETPLTELWTNIEKGTSSYALWAHEWNKHGTCAAVLESLNSELKYFTKGLDFLKQYSMNEILQDAKIIPSNEKEYSLAEIHNAVKVKLGVNAVIECRKEEEGKNWLVEIRICFRKDLELIDCDAAFRGSPVVLLHKGDFVTALSNCDSTILYPDEKVLGVTAPTGLYVQLYKLVSWLQWFTL